MLEIDLNKALAANDISKAVKIRQEIDSLSDEVKTEDKAKESFFGRIKSHLKKANNVSESESPSPQPTVTAKPITVIPVEEKEPYKGLLTDCGKCLSCDPPPSEITHFHHLSGGACERPIPMPVKEVTEGVLLRSSEFRTSNKIEELQNKVTSVLEDRSKSAMDDGASIAANEVRDMLWEEHSEKSGNKDTSRGGFISAAITTDIFYALGREKELGWIEGDAPGYNRNIERAMRSDGFFSSMQKVLSESPSSYARKHPAPKR